MPPRRELHDKYFKLAKAEGYAARSAYKLKQINERRRILSPGMRVIDLGCAPGSWLQVAAELVGPRKDGGGVQGGRVVGLDLQRVEIPLPPWAGALVGDVFTHDVDELRAAGGLGAGEYFDAVLSDMAPSTTGNDDHYPSVALCRRVLELLPRLLASGGALAMKVFEGAEYPALLRETGRVFDFVKGFKPDATRGVSKEMYVIGDGYCPTQEQRRAMLARASTPGTAPASPVPRPGWGSVSSADRGSGGGRERERESGGGKGGRAR